MFLSDEFLSAATAVCFDILTLDMIVEANPLKGT